MAGQNILQMDAYHNEVLIDLIYRTKQEHGETFTEFIRTVKYYRDNCFRDYNVLYVNDILKIVILHNMRNKDLAKSFIHDNLSYEDIMERGLSSDHPETVHAFK